MSAAGVFLTLLGVWSCFLLGDLTRPYALRVGWWALYIGVLAPVTLFCAGALLFWAVAIPYHIAAHFLGWPPFL